MKLERMWKRKVHAQPCSLCKFMKYQECESGLGFQMIQPINMSKEMLQIASQTDEIMLKLFTVLAQNFPIIFS